MLSICSTILRAIVYTRTQRRSNVTVIYASLDKMFPAGSAHVSLTCLQAKGHSDMCY